MSLCHARIIDGAIKAETLYGIELLNEPWGVEEPVWTTCRDKFYPLGYAKIREYFQQVEESKRPWVTIQNGFRYLFITNKVHEKICFYNNIGKIRRPMSDFINYMPEPDFNSVSADTHAYQCFGSYWNQLAERPEGWSTHLEASCNFHNEVRLIFL